MRYASPDANPPDPATNSATTAPTSARPPEMRSPARKYGSADQFGGRRFDPRRGVGEHREERDDRCTDHQRGERVADPYDDQRRDGDDRCDLKHHRPWLDSGSQQSAGCDAYRQHNAQQSGDQQCSECHHQRRSERPEQSRRVGQERRYDRRRSRYQIGRHAGDPHRRFPDQQCGQSEQGWRVLHAASARCISRVTCATSAAYAGSNRASAPGCSGEAISWSMRPGRGVISTMRRARNAAS